MLQSHYDFMYKIAVVEYTEIIRKLPIGWVEG